jgi:hypothetical protein
MNSFWKSKITEAERVNISNNKTVLLNKMFQQKTIITPHHFEEVCYLFPFDVLKKQFKKECLLKWKTLCRKETKPTLEVIKESLVSIRNLKERGIAELKFRGIHNTTQLLEYNFWSYPFIKIQPETTTYAELLKHPLWQRKRLEIMQRDGFKCCKCKNDQITLNVHHKKYIYGRKPWEYDNADLITLCEDCHSKESL